MSEKDKKDLKIFCIVFGIIILFDCFIIFGPSIKKGIDKMVSDYKEKQMKKKAQEYADSVSLEFDYDLEISGTTDEESYAEMRILLSWVNEKKELIYSYTQSGGEKLKEYWEGSEHAFSGRYLSEEMLEDKETAYKEQILSIASDVIGSIFEINEGSLHGRGEAVANAFIEDGRIFRLSNMSEGKQPDFSFLGITETGTENKELVQLLYKMYPDILLGKIRSRLSDLNSYTGYGSEKYFSQTYTGKYAMCVKQLINAVGCGNELYDSKQTIGEAFRQYYLKAETAWNNRHKNSNISVRPGSGSNNYYYYDDGDLYDAKDYDDGDEFADEYEDEFDDWDDAYDYWEEYH